LAGLGPASALGSLAPAYSSAPTMPNLHNFSSPSISSLAGMIPSKIQGAF
jgi:hypothetical protein